MFSAQIHGLICMIIKLYRDKKFAGKSSKVEKY